MNITTIIAAASIISMATTPALSSPIESTFIGFNTCSQKLIDIASDVMADDTVKVAKVGESLYLQSPRGSVHVWCDKGEMKISRGAKDPNRQDALVAGSH